MDENQIVSAFESSLSEPEANPTPEAPPAAQDAPPPQQESDIQPESEQAKEPETESVDTIEIDPDEPLFEQEIEIDGKKSPVKRSLRELQQGYMNGEDYRQGKLALAREKDEIPRIVATQVKPIHEQATRAVKEIQELVLKTIAAELHGVDFEQVSKEDPFKANELFFRAQKLANLQQTIKKELDEREAKAKEEEQKLKAEKWVKESLPILQRDIPDFGPPVVKRLIETGEEWGFSREEVSQWDDHRLIKMLHALSDKKAVEAKRPEVEKKVAVVTKVVKPGQPSKARSANDEAMAKLRKSGKPEDALAIFEAHV